MRERQVQWLACAIEDRLDGHRTVGDVGDKPDRVAQVERACLAGDIARGKILSQEALEIGALGLADDLAGTVGIELVDHHPVVAERRLHQPGGNADQAIDLVDGGDATNHGAGQLECRGRLSGGRLQLDDRRVAEAVGGNIECGAGRQGEPEAQRRARRVGDAGEGVAHGVRPVGSDHLVKRPSVRISVEPEHGGRVGRVPQHPCRRDVAGEQAAMRLDAARNMDRLTIAIVEGDGGAAHRGSSTARWATAKVASAAPTAPSRSNVGALPRRARNRRQDSADCACRARWRAPYRSDMPSSRARP